MKKKEDASVRARSLYTARADLYQFFFVQLIGYGSAIKKFFIRQHLLTPGMKVLDAGCGAGLLTKIHYELSKKQRVNNVSFFAFDLTPRMLEKFKSWITNKEAEKDIALLEQDVLKLQNLPTHWTQFDLILSSAMFEYIPRSKLPNAIKNLISLLSPGGRFFLCITGTNILTKLLVGFWWNANIYTIEEMKAVLNQAGATRVKFHSLPGIYRVLPSSAIMVEIRSESN